MIFFFKLLKFFHFWTKNTTLNQLDNTNKVDFYKIKKVEEFIYYHNELLKNNSILDIEIFYTMETNNYFLIENLHNGLDCIKISNSFKRKYEIKDNKGLLISYSKIDNISEIIDILDDDYVGMNIFAKYEK